MNSETILSFFFFFSYSHFLFFSPFSRYFSYISLFSLFFFLFTYSLCLSFILLISFGFTSHYSGFSFTVSRCPGEKLFENLGMDDVMKSFTLGKSCSGRSSCIPKLRMTLLVTPSPCIMSLNSQGSGTLCSYSLHGWSHF